MGRRRKQDHDELPGIAPYREEIEQRLTKLWNYESMVPRFDEVTDTTTLKTTGCKTSR